MSADRDSIPVMHPAAVRLGSAHPAVTGVSWRPRSQDGGGAGRSSAPGTRGARSASPVTAGSVDPSRTASRRWRGRRSWPAPPPYAGPEHTHVTGVSEGLLRQEGAGGRRPSAPGTRGARRASPVTAASAGPSRITSSIRAGTISEPEPDRLALTRGRTSPARCAAPPGVPR